MVPLSFSTRNQSDIISITYIFIIHLIYPLKHSKDMDNGVTVGYMGLKNCILRRFTIDSRASTAYNARNSCVQNSVCITHKCMCTCVYMCELMNQP